SLCDHQGVSRQGDPALLCRKGDAGSSCKGRIRGSLVEPALGSNFLQVLRLGRETEPRGPGATFLPPLEIIHPLPSRHWNHPISPAYVSSLFSRQGKRKPCRIAETHIHQPPLAQLHENGGMAVSQGPASFLFLDCSRHQPGPVSRMLQQTM